MASEMLQQFDLAQCPLGEDFLAEDIGHFLDCDSLARLAVRGCAEALSVRCVQVCNSFIPDDAVCTLSKLFGNRVSLVNYKVLVEDLEHLSP